MNNTPSLNQINKNSFMNPNMLTKYYKLKIMNDFMNIKYQNPKMTQSEITSQVNMSPSTIKTIKRYRNDINMISPYRNNLKKQQKRPKSIIMVTSKDLNSPQMISGELQLIKKQDQKMC